ncbi:MAG: hypothetical protein Q9209_000686 [Squamulea sp. 1 TL-2023]
MPKRPCAIAFTPDQETIICGDKFGDVYALPLVFHDTSKDVQSDFGTAEQAQEDRTRTEDTFVSSATLRTVHTLRNQEALRHQQNLKNQKSSKNVMDFQRQLLLGHVSLLTDLICVSVSKPSIAEPSERTYIITADRDEHIRVSRGMPQAYIIEGFCLGHTQFVSKLCIPCWNPQWLISGGGDDYLLVWDWLSNRILCQTDLRGVITNFFARHNISSGIQNQGRGAAETDARWIGQIAVSELCTLERTIVAGKHRKQVVVTCEGIPAIFFFDITEDGTMDHVDSVATDAAVTTLVLSPDHCHIVYAMDVSLGSLSRSDSADRSGSSEGKAIGILECDALNGSWEKHHILAEAINDALRDLPMVLDDIMGAVATRRSSASFVNSLENLRKRGQEE